MYIVFTVPVGIWLISQCISKLEHILIGLQTLLISFPLCLARILLSSHSIRRRRGKKLLISRLLLWRGGRGSVRRCGQGVDRRQREWDRNSSRVHRLTRVRIRSHQRCGGFATRSRWDSFTGLNGEMRKVHHTSGCEWHRAEQHGVLTMRLGSRRLHRQSQLILFKRCQ